LLPKLEHLLYSSREMDPQDDNPRTIETVYMVQWTEGRGQDKYVSVFLFASLEGVRQFLATYWEEWEDRWYDDDEDFVVDTMPDIPSAAEIGRSMRARADRYNSPLTILIRSTRDFYIRITIEEKDVCP